MELARYLQNEPSDFVVAAQYFEDAFLKNIQERHPDIDLSKVHMVVSKWDGNASTIYSYELAVGADDFGGGRFALFRDDTQTLDFHISIDHQDFKRSGAMGYVLSKALTRCPTAQRIPNMLGEENLIAFLSKTFRTAENFRKFSSKNLQKLSPDQLRVFKMTILNALRETPAIKVRARLGFGKIEKVIIDPDTLRVFSDVRKGLQNPEEEIPLFIHWSRHVSDEKFKIMSDGKLTNAVAKDLIIHERWQNDLPAQAYLPERYSDMEGL